MPRGDEGRVQAAFEQWLAKSGWTLRAKPERGDVDVDAVHPDGRRLLAEVKGETSAPGLDIDTAYGQLLRRMTSEENTTYAVVVSERGVTAALRVPQYVRHLLAVTVYAVNQEGDVRFVA
ncbi:hypothetical protein ABZV61_12900 [Streptomyces sp900116325]|uniref:Restriction endonuclease type IV Mrr domain-containing protein n=1 Tax=Streptomyces sp. 900116325 TaxID=3154295 RepID=A0ABV2U767_9ACTN